jgi:hypothetical protein
MRRVLLVRGGQIALGQARGEQLLRITNTDKNGIQRAAVFVTHDSAKPTGPFRPDKDGNCVIRLDGGFVKSITFEMGETYFAVPRAFVRFPMIVNLNPSDGGARLVEKGGSEGKEITFVEVIAGNSKPTNAPTEHRVRVTDRKEKGIESATVKVKDKKGAWTTVAKTNRDGWATLADDSIADFRSISVSVGSYHHISLAKELIGWPFVVVFEMDE